jgi:hypothetical protein
MPKPLWRWVESAHNYQNVKTGQFIGRAKMLAMRDEFVENAKARAAELATRVAQPGWQQAMRDLIRETYIDQYAMARGGRNNMTQSDWGRIGQMCREQYKYLRDFAADIVAGKLSEAQIAARAKLYMASSRQAFEKGKTYGAGIPPLPAYPGDGSTACKSNCLCYWSIEEFPNEYRCTWTLTAAEHCPDCLERASKWAPYRIPKF